jgi:hypothetical protein
MNTFHDPTLERCQMCGAPTATWAMTLHKNWKRFAILITVGCVAP